MDMTQLLALQAEDGHIRDLQHEVSALLPQRKAAAHARLAKARKEVEAAEAAVVESQRKYGNFQHDNARQREAMARAERNQMNVFSERAINASMQEHAKAASAASAAAAAASASSEVLTAEERALEEKRAIEASEDVAVQEILSAIAERQAAIEAQIEALTTQREALAKEVPAPLLSYYERLRKNVWPCVVDYDRSQGLCNGCNLLQPASVTQVVLKADQSNDPTKMVTCPSCGRILL